MPQETPSRKHSKPDVRHDGQRIREFRKVHDMSAPQLAAAVGLTRTALLNIESGWRGTKPEVLIRIARVLQVRLSDIMRESPDGSNGDGAAA